MIKYFNKLSGIAYQTKVPSTIPPKTMALATYRCIRVPNLLYYLRKYVKQVGETCQNLLNHADYLLPLELHLPQSHLCLLQLGGGK